MLVATHAWNRHIEERAHVGRHVPAVRVDEMDGNRRGFEVAQHALELSGVHEGRDLVAQELAAAEPPQAGVEGDLELVGAQHGAYGHVGGALAGEGPVVAACEAAEDDAAVVRGEVGRHVGYA